MPSYEQKINSFAEGKSLLRLARPIRNRADAFCDACGSAQARKLYALADLETGRHYFVGETCLKELAKRGVVSRRFGRESGKVAYETEMNLRSLRQSNGETRSGNRDTHWATGTTKPRISKEGEPATNPGEEEHFSPVSLLLETAEHYQAIVSIVSAGGTAVFTATALEERYEDVWSIGGEGGLILEKARRERCNAARMCLQRAWVEAKSRFDAQGGVMENTQQNNAIVEQLLPLLHLGPARRPPRPLEDA